jgi:hypothetical protein
MSRDPEASANRREPPPEPLAVRLVARSVIWFLAPAILLFTLIPMLLMVAGPVPASTVLPCLGALVTLLTLAIFESMSRVTVGRDGVLWRRLGRKSRFVPFSAIESASESEGRQIDLKLRSGETFSIYTAREENFGKERYVEACNRLLDRIRAGVAHYKSLHEEGGDEEHDRRVEALADRLRIGEGEGRAQPGYRAAEPPSREDLWEAVEDEDAPPAVRARAASLLAKQGSEDDRAELSRVAEGMVDPALGKRLRIAAEGGESGLDEEEDAESEEESRRRRL